MTVDSARAKSIFLAASELPSPAQRAEYLERQCGSDGPLRARVEALLRAHDAADSNDNLLSGEAYEVTRDAPASLNAGTMVGGRYKLLESIGEGGMGSVWVAEQKEPVKRKVAVKLIKPGMDSAQVLARFEVERQALALMDHPNIAKVYDGGMTEQGHPYFVMELVKGVPLTEYCDQARLSLKDRLDLFIPVCQAVQHAHQKGVIHRDLKPSNILICLYDGKPVPKVIDFGLAKAMHQSLTEQTLHTAFGMMVGTPLYMSPEQAEHNNLDVDTRTDIYSLGVILYELLTGSTPLERQQLKEAAYNEILRLIKEVEPPKPSTRISGSVSLPSIAAQRSIEPNQLRKSLTGDLDWIVMKALDKERGRRYETANGLLRDVERFLNDEAVEACPPSTAYRLKKFLHRNRAMVTAVSAVAAALTIGIFGFAWQAKVANEQREVAYAAKEAESKQRMIAEEQTIAAEANASLANDRLALIEAERAKAETARQIAQAVSDFLQRKLLSQASPWGQSELLFSAGQPQGLVKPNITVLEVLDRAASELSPDQIESNFPDQTPVQIELLKTVAMSYGGLGQPAKMKDHLERALELADRHYGKDSPVSLGCKKRLRAVLVELGERPRANLMLQELLASQQRVYGPDHPETLQTRASMILSILPNSPEERAQQIRELESLYMMMVSSLGADHENCIGLHSVIARVYLSAGDFRKGVSIHEEICERKSRLLGNDHLSTLESLELLASSYWVVGRTQESLSLYRELVRKYQKSRGPDDLKTLSVESSLANIVVQSPASTREDVEQACQAFERSIKHFGTTYGPTSPSTLNIKNSLANALLRCDRSEEAVALAKEASEEVLRTLGRASEYYWAFRDTLADAYLANKQPEEAIQTQRAVLETAREVFGPDHGRTRMTRGKLIQAYQAAGRLTEAVEVARQMYPAESQDLADTLAILARSLLSEGSASETEHVLRECLSIREKLIPADWKTSNTRSLLGEALIKQNKFSEAELMLLQGYEQLKGLEPTLPEPSRIRVIEALQRIPMLYEAWHTAEPDKGYDAKAAEWKAKLD